MPIRLAALASLCLALLAAPLAAQVLDTPYHDQVWDDNIQTVLAHREGWELSRPILRLGTDDALRFSFDDLSGRPNDYQYTILHCNADWTPSDLLPLEYLEGFETSNIWEFDYSASTLQKFINYHVVFPNSDCRPLLSGNYIFKVFRNYDPEQVVLTRRFYVLETRMDIAATVKPAAHPSLRYTHQQIELSLHDQGLNIRDPYRELLVGIGQNQREDNMVWGIQPDFTNQGTYTYRDRDYLIFPGGNEFRHFDAKNIRFKEIQTDSIYLLGQRYHFQLATDLERRFNTYTFQDDLNGRRLVKIEGRNDSQAMADYVTIHFRLRRDAEFHDGELFVFGQISDWAFPESHRMSYNPHERAYVLALKVKQGYYTYQYAYLRHGTNVADLAELEGDFYQTENEYVVWVYHRAPSQRHDALVAMEVFSSIR